MGRGTIYTLKVGYRPEKLFKMKKSQKPKKQKKNPLCLLKISRKNLLQCTYTIFFPNRNGANVSSFVFNESAFSDKIKQTKTHTIACWCHDKRDIVLFESDISKE